MGFFVNFSCGVKIDEECISNTLGSKYFLNSYTDDERMTWGFVKSIANSDEAATFISKKILFNEDLEVELDYEETPQDALCNIFLQIILKNIDTLKEITGYESESESGCESESESGSGSDSESE